MRVGMTPFLAGLLASGDPSVVENTATGDSSHFVNFHGEKSELGARAASYNRLMVSVVDMEPDDYAALLAAITLVRPSQIPFVGAAYMHAGLKAELARRVVRAQRMPQIPVLQGRGGNPSDYINITSTRMSLQYTGEGHGVFSEAELAAHLAAARSSDALIEGFVHLLSARRDQKDVDVVSLTHCDDLAEALRRDPSLAASIAHHHMVGGVKNLGANKNQSWDTQEWQDGEYRTSFNWNIGPHAINALQQYNIPTTLWSVGRIYEQFPGGGVGVDSAPGIIESIKRAAMRNQAVRDWLTKTASWNTHWRGVMQVPLGSTDSLNHDFIPADPLGVIGAMFPEIILRQRPIELNIDTNDLTDRGYRVHIRDNGNSKLNLVTEIDKKRFLEILHAVIEAIPATDYP